jgi:hypothetical protein
MSRHLLDDATAATTSAAGIGLSTAATAAATTAAATAAAGRGLSTSATTAAAGIGLSTAAKAAATTAAATAAAGIGLSTAAATYAAAGIGLGRALVATKRFKMQIIKILNIFWCHLQTAFGCIYCGMNCLLVPFLPVGQIKSAPWLGLVLKRPRLLTLASCLREVVTASGNLFASKKTETRTAQCP